MLDFFGPPAFWVHICRDVERFRRKVDHAAFHLKLDRRTVDELAKLRPGTHRWVEIVPNSDLLIEVSIQPKGVASLVLRGYKVVAFVPYLFHDLCGFTRSRRAYVHKALRGSCAWAIKHATLQLFYASMKLNVHLRDLLNYTHNTSSCN